MKAAILVAVFSIMVGGAAAQILLPLNGMAAGVDDTIIGAAVSAFVGISAHYFPKG